MVEGLGDRIRAVRAEAGLTQEAFGRRIGVSQGAVANFERGREPQAGVVVAIVRRFGVDPAWLLLGEGDRDA